MLGTIIDIKYNLDTDEMLIGTTLGVFYGKAPVPVFGSDNIFIDRLKKLSIDVVNVSHSYLLGISRGKAYYYMPTGMKSIDIQTAEVVKYLPGDYPQEVKTIGSVDYISKKVISTNQDLLGTEISYETNDTKIDIAPTKYPNLNNVAWI